MIILREPTRTFVPWDFTTFRAPPDHCYRDLGILHSRCDQLSLALAESCWGGRSPVIASPRVSPPSDALCHPRPDSSSLKIVIVQEMPPAILLLQSLFKQRYHEPFVPGALYSDNRRLRSRESPSPKQVGVAFKPLRMISPPRALPGTRAWSFPSRSSSSKRRLQYLALAVAFQGALSRTIRSWRRSCDYRRLRSRESPSPLQVGVAFKGFPLSIVNGFASRGSPSPSGWDSPQGVPPSLQRMGFASRGSPSPSE